MSNRNNEKLHEMIDRAYNLLMDAAEVKSDLNELKKELGKAKDCYDQYGFKPADVVRLAKAKLDEEKLKAKSAKIAEDLATVDFFKDWKTTSKRVA